MRAAGSPGRPETKEKSMDVIRLPLLRIDTPLKLALETMREKKRSAVVGWASEAAWLFRAGAVVQGLARGRESLSQLRRTWQIAFAERSDLRKLGILLEKPHSEPRRIEQFLDKTEQAYMMGTDMPPKGLEAAGFKDVEIITRHEELASKMGSAPLDCYCTDPSRGDDPHEYSHPLPSDGLCTYDRSQIVCA